MINNAWHGIEHYLMPLLGDSSQTSELFSFFEAKLNFGMMRLNKWKIWYSVRMTSILCAGTP